MKRQFPSDPAPRGPLLLKMTGTRPTPLSSFAPNPKRVSLGLEVFRSQLLCLRSPRTHRNSRKGVGGASGGAADEPVDEDGGDDVEGEELAETSREGGGTTGVGPGSSPGQREPLLPPAADPARLTIVLDIDETLLHSRFVHLEGSQGSKPAGEHDFGFLVDSPDPANPLPQSYREVKVWKRPGLDTFLTRVAELGDVVLWTAAMPAYANPLIDILDADRFLSGRFTRVHTTQSGRNFLKDLSLLGRPLERTILVDNSIVSFSTHPDNGVPITSFWGGPQDTALAELADFIATIKDERDVRPVLRERFALAELLQKSQKKAEELGK